MKHYRNNGYAHGADLIKQLIGKMQSCSRGCRRALLTGIYSLISFRIVKSLPDIRRKRHESYLVQKNICVLIDRAVIFKADYTVSLLDDIGYLGGKLAVAENQLCADFCPFAGFTSVSQTSVPL